MRKFRCSICGYVCDESLGVPERSITPGTRWEDIPDDFTCPICTAPKAVFEELEEMPLQEPAFNADREPVENLMEMSAGEISAICSNLAKGCEKQRLMDEMEAFQNLAMYFKSKAATEKGKTLDDAAGLVKDDMTQGLAAANTAAKAEADRGALRSLVWCEKVSMMMKTLLDRFAKEGDGLLEHTRVYVCGICGFIMLGDAPPEICPVCKVPNFKITQVERG